MVNVLEAILQYELVSVDGEVVLRNRYDRVCISSPDLCSLPAGGKSPKESENKQKTKQQQQQQQQQRIKTGREKKNGKGTRRNFCTHGSSYLFKYFQSLPSTPVNRSKLQVLLFKNSNLKPRRLFPSTGKNPLIISVK